MNVDLLSKYYLFRFTGSMANILVAPLILKYAGSRRMMLLAAVGSSLGWGLAAIDGSLLQLQLILGLLLSFFENMFFYCANVVFQSWMEKKRVFGNATVFCGVPLGAMGMVLKFYAFKSVKTFVI